MRTIPLLLAAALATSAFAGEIQYRTLRQSELPASLAVQGSYEHGVSWRDANGQNLVVFSRRASRGQGGRNADLIVVGYRLDAGKSTPVWHVHDWIHDCELDLPVFFERRSIEVSDVDANAVGEVSFVYRMACLGGMDYIDEKLFLIENGKKFPIRGATQYVRNSALTGKQIYDGEMKIDKAFDDAPKAFRAFAIKKWKRFRTPSFE